MVFMFRSFPRLAVRTLPIFAKLLGFSVALYTFNKASFFIKPTSNFNFPFIPTNMAGEVISKVVRIQQNDQLVGYAYCFDHKEFVTTSYELYENKSPDQYEFYIGTRKLETKFKIIGKFQNLTFLQATNDIVEPMPVANPHLITSVQIIRKMAYLSIKSGYYVADDCGFGIIDGKGEAGSLVINNYGVLGVVTQVGRDSDRGFLRMIHWRELKNIVKRIKKTPMYLGISAKSIEQRDGISVIRVASNSPLRDKIQMGEIITKVNNYKIHQPQDLLRSIMVSGEFINIEVQKQNNEKKIISLQIG